MIESRLDADTTYALKNSLFATIYKKDLTIKKTKQNVASSCQKYT